MGRFPKIFFVLLLVFVVAFGVFIPNNMALANALGDALLSFFGWFVSTIIELVGGILTLLISLLIDIASFNDFLTPAAPAAIHIGWRAVRDLSNMGFIIALMVIAFGTIMKLQQYHAKNALMKLIIMAILINFSKTITGIFIDFAQVVMMTFVNSLGGGSVVFSVLFASLNIQEMLNFAKSEGGAANIEATIGASLLAIAFLVVACAVILATLAILYARILMLWILVIMSPIAYIATVLPNSQKYASQWWSSLGKNLISGPLLAFFLWLSFSIMTMSSAQPITVKTNPSTGGSEIMSAQNLGNYIIAIGLLIASLMMTQSLGVMGGRFAGNMVGKLQGMGQWIAKAPFKGAWKAAKYSDRKIGAWTGVSVGGTIKGLKAGFEQRRLTDERKRLAKSGRNLERGGILGGITGMGSAQWMENYAPSFAVWRKDTRSRWAHWAGRGSRGSADRARKEKEAAERELREMKQAVGEKNRVEIYLNLREDEKKKVEQEIADLQKKAQEAWDRDDYTTYDDLKVQIQGKQQEQLRVDQDVVRLNNMDFRNQDQTAKTYLKEEAKKKLEESYRLAEKGMTDEQRRHRQDEIEGIQAEIPKLSEEMRKMQNLGDRSGIKQIRRLMTEREEERRRLEEELRKGEATPEEQKENQQQIDRLTREATDLKHHGTKAFISEADREQRKQAAEAAQQRVKAADEIVKRQAVAKIIDFDAEQTRRAEIAERAKKRDTESGDEQKAWFQSALARRNSADAGAACLSAAKSGNMNDLISNVRATQDWYEDPDTGQLTTEAKAGSKKIFEKGDYLSEGIEGLHVFMREIFQKQFKQNETSLLLLENDLSNILYSRGQATFGYAVGFKDGDFYQRSRTDQQAVVTDMRSKSPLPRVWGEGNRLAICSGEWNDPKDPSKGMRYILNEGALYEMISRGDALQRLFERGNFNPNTAEYLVRDNEELLNFALQQTEATRRDGLEKTIKNIKSLAGLAKESKEVHEEIQKLHESIQQLSKRK